MAKGECIFCNRNRYQKMSAETGEDRDRKFWVCESHFDTLKYASLHEDSDSCLFCNENPSNKIKVSNQNFGDDILVGVCDEHYLRLISHSTF